MHGGRTEEVSRRQRVIATLMVMGGSLMVLLPIVATVPYLPPFGLMMLLGWRLRRNDMFPAWAGLPLGAFDDLVSGQPLGLAMLCWTACLLCVDMLDTRLVWRSFRQDWLIAAGGIAATLILGRLVASPVSAHVDTAMLLQIIVAMLLVPATQRLCNASDERMRRTRLG
jgi:rod shape-determining protein MreD